MEDGNYILEYSEEQGKFHFNDGTRIPETFGWRTICKSISHDQCFEFANLMEEKYPELKHSSWEVSSFPDFEKIMEEFKTFLMS